MAVWENNRKFAIGKQRLGIMIETNDRKLPVGIQSFEEIRKQGCLYVDKTDIIWQLANRGKKYNYLLAELKNRLKISIFLWRKSCAYR